MPSIFLSRRLPEKTMDSLMAHFDLSYNPEPRALLAEELIRGARGNAGIITLLSDRIDRNFLTAVPELKMIANYAVGYNNIDIQAAADHQVVVSNTPGVLTETTADTAFALLMSTARRIVEADQFVRDGKWKGWYPTEFLGRDIWGSKLGIIGLGRIGKALARRALAFQMQIKYWNRTRLSLSQEKELGLTYAEFPDLLAWADMLSLHVPYNKDTHHLIGAAELKQMNPSAYLINTARGAVIDENALVSALKNGQIAGAGLDVYEAEPKIHPGLIDLPNVVLLPHLGSASKATREKMGALVIENLLAFFDGRAVPNQVRPT